MSKSIKAFNGLNGTIGIEEVEKLAILAKQEGQTTLYNRLTSGLELAKKHNIENFNPGALAWEEIPGADLPGMDEIPSYISPEDFTGLNKAVSPDEIYQYITDLILNTIKNVGSLPWQRTWEKTGFSDGKQATNYESKKGYRGINFFLLNFEVLQDENGDDYMDFINFENPYFLTFKQIEKNKGQLKKGAKGKRVVYFTRLYSHSEELENGEKLEFSTYDQKKFKAWIIKNQAKLKILKRPGMTIERLANNIIPILKYYNVFNGADVTGIKWDEMPINENATKTDKEKIEIAEAILKSMPVAPKVNFGGNQPAYYPGTDSILIPAIEKFNSEQEYYSTFFHELVHSTGHKKRLSRPGITLGRLATKLDYAKEELVAEMGAVFLCAESGILFHIIDNSAAYLKGWNSRLVKSMEEDNRFYFRAASASQAAADYMLDRDKDGVPAYRKQVASLNAPWHEGLAKQALNNCSRLNPGYKYDTDGKLQRSKVTLKTLKDTATKAADFEAAYKGAMLLDVPAKVVGQLRDKYNKDLKLNPKQVFEAFYKDVTDMNVGKKKTPARTAKKVDAAVPPKKEVVAKEKKKGPKTGKDFPLILEFPIDEINLDTSRFQNRAKLNEKTVQNIVENFTATQFDPVILWTDPKNKKVYLLAGHHRLEAYKRLYKDNVPSKFANKDYPTEAEAIKYARQLSNANRTLETPMERAKIYREMLASGETIKAVEKASKIEGKNQNYILNIAALNDNGRVIEALERLADTPDKQNEKALEKIADWTGEARRKYPQLTNAHETEMFKFLNDASASKRIKTKSDFLQKIYSLAGTLDFDDTVLLNLNRVKYESEGEKAYNKDYSEMKQNISDKMDTITTIKARFNDPSRADYENPSKKDYKEVKSRADDKISQLNTEIGRIQKRMIELQRNKGSYTKAGQEQAALFGTKSKKTVSRKRKTVKKRTKNGLKSPDIEIEPKTNAGGQSIGGSLRPLLSGKHPKVRSIKHQAEKNPMFAINGETGKFLQAVEKKPKDSVIVTLDGEQGAGKTTALYKFQNDFAIAGNRCLFASLEEHPSSNLATNKKDLHLSPQAQENIDTVGSFESYSEFMEICQNYDAIFIDSWQKLIGMIGTIRLDEDIRKKFDGKVFFIVFQQTVEGRTKGGASIVFDGDIVTKMVKMPSFTENYAYFDKNRYTTIPIEKLKFMIAEGRTIIEGEPLQEFTEAPPQIPMTEIVENQATYNFKVY